MDQRIIQKRNEKEKKNEMREIHFFGGFSSINAHETNSISSIEFTLRSDKNKYCLLVVVMNC